VDQILKKADELTQLKGISKVHHIMNLSGGSRTIMYRPLSCHCSRPNICECFQPQKWNFGLEDDAPVRHKLGGFVAVVYGDRWYLGKVVDFVDGFMEIAYMREHQRNK
jgi:hypothetical protein